MVSPSGEGASLSGNKPPEVRALYFPVGRGLEIGIHFFYKGRIVFCDVRIALSATPPIPYGIRCNFREPCGARSNGKRFCECKLHLVINIEKNSVPFKALLGIF
jgi:hypothetical protein